MMPDNAVPKRSGPSVKQQPSSDGIRHWFGVKINGQSGRFFQGLTDHDLDLITQYGVPPRIKVFHHGTANIELLRSMPILLFFGEPADTYDYFERWWRKQGITNYPLKHQLEAYN